MRIALALLAATALSGCLAQNLGLESVHKPIVADGHAFVHNCPDWSSQGVDSAAATDSNFGCATNSNLAAMVANPDDLVHGKADHASNAETATRTIGAWRTRPAGGASGGSTSPSSGGGMGGPKGLN